MAPSVKKLRSALLDATCQVFKAEPDATSVNKVRKQAEENLGLEEGFFMSSEWKPRSKTMIKEFVEKLLEGWQPDDTTKREEEDEEVEEEKPDTKNGIKRRSSELESPEPKKLKRRGRPSKNLKEESSTSDLDEKEPRPKKKSAAPRRKVKASESDEEDAIPRRKQSRSKVVDSDDEDPDVKPSPSPDRKRKREDEDEKEVTVKTCATESDDDKEQFKKHRPSDEDEDEKPDIEQTKEEDSKPVVDEEEEYSDVIDEPLAPKRKKGVKKEPKAKSATAKKPSAPTSEDPKEAEIKKLQGQLVKCGVRKLWHNELKRYGNDDRAKIRHLKEMLTDVGMDGRFSEARAREIKEMRELQAEVEAAQDMNSLWGTAGRASRSRAKAKSMKEDTDVSDEEGGDPVHSKDEDDEDEEKTTVAAKRRARADLAFLGDDSDSD